MAAVPRRVVAGNREGCGASVLLFPATSCPPDSPMDISLQLEMQIFVKTLTGKTITLEFFDSNSFTTPLQQQVKYKAKCEAMKRINKE